MLYCKAICIIVDAYSTGKHLAPIIKAQGYSCVHIKSSLTLPSKYEHISHDFIMSLTYDGNIMQILDPLKSYQVKFCLPGYESGVELADLLSEQLNLPGNKSAYSIRKRNKYVMNEAVTQAGLATVKHYQSNQLTSLMDWVKTVNNYPIVAKPLDSANGDGVFFCNNDQELEQAFLTITSSLNQFGVRNLNVLVESFNKGTEYIINTVSWNKKHFVAEIWKVVRQPYSTIYEKAEIIPHTETVWILLSDYTFNVLDALGIEYGAATTEVKYTVEQGAVLLETSGRLMGNSPLSFSQEIVGCTQLSLLIEAYLRTDDFLSRFNRPRLPQTLQGMIVVLISNCEGKIYRNFSHVFKQLETL